MEFVPHIVYSIQVRQNPHPLSECSHEHNVVLRYLQHKFRKDSDISFKENVIQPTSFKIDEKLSDCNVKDLHLLLHPLRRYTNCLVQYFFYLLIKEQQLCYSFILCMPFITKVCMVIMIILRLTDCINLN